jgi:hypothetical protein
MPSSGSWLRSRGTDTVRAGSGISSASARIAVLRPWRSSPSATGTATTTGFLALHAGARLHRCHLPRPQQHRHGQVRMARLAAIRGSAPGRHDSYELAHGRGAQRGGNAVRQPHADARAPPTLTDDELAQELLESRRRLQAPLGRCDAVAYPFEDWDSRTAAAAAGYRFAFALPPMSHAKVSA